MMNRKTFQQFKKVLCRIRSKTENYNKYKIMSEDKLDKFKLFSESSGIKKQLKLE